MSEFKWDRFTIKTGHFYIVTDNAGHEALLHFKPDESISHFLEEVVEQVNAAIKERAGIEAGLVRACEAAQTAFTMWELFADCGPDDAETCYDAWEKSRIDALKSGVAAIAAARGNDEQGT